MPHRENHQPDSLPYSHVTLWYVTYFTNKVRRNENHQKYGSIYLWFEFEYGKKLATVIKLLW